MPVPTPKTPEGRYVSKSKYQGRHRPGLPAIPPAPQASPHTVPAETPFVSVDAVDTHVTANTVEAPAHPAGGRHRAVGRTGVPRFAGTGLLLPSAAAATLVLTATGAHLGSSSTLGPSALGLSSATASSPSGATSAAQTVESAAALAAETRVNQARAARSAARQTAAAVAAETAHRAQVEKQLANQAPLQISTTAPSHAWVPYLDAQYTLTSGFGMRWGTLHPGQDFAVPVGTPIKAMSSGTVIFAGWSGGYGNKMEIRYWDGTISWMAHNSVLKVSVGDTVSPGEVVALSGNTGHSTGPHSHLEIHLGGDETNAGAIPPIPWLVAKGIMPGRSGGNSAGSDHTDTTTGA